MENAQVEEDAWRRLQAKLQRLLPWRSTRGRGRREEEEEETGAEAHCQRERGTATEPVRLSGLSPTPSSLATRSEMDGPDSATPHAVRLVDWTESTGSSRTQARTL